MTIDMRLNRATIQKVIHEFAPVRIHLTPTDEDRSFLELEEPTLIEMVPGRGVRVVCSGRVRYALGPIAVPLTMRRLSVLLVPEIVEGRTGQPALGFGIEIEDSDLELLPGLVEGAIAHRVNPALTPAESPLRFELADALTKSFKLPERLEPLDCFGIKMRQASIVVDDEGLSLSITLDLAISRTKERATDDKPVRDAASASYPDPH
jgi:hypothetical protein